MTDWVRRPDVDSEADEATVVWLAVRQLQREVGALKEQAAPTPEPSAELAALRARCERLRDYALAERAYVELLERGHTERIPGTMAKTSRWVSEAYERLQPGDLADLDAAKGEGNE